MVNKCKVCGKVVKNKYCSIECYSKSRKGRIYSDITRKRLSQSLKGHLVSEETRHKIGQANTKKAKLSQLKILLKIIKHGIITHKGLIKELTGLSDKVYRRYHSLLEGKGYYKKYKQQHKVNINIQKLGIDKINEMLRIGSNLTRKEIQTMFKLDTMRLDDISRFIKQNGLKCKRSIVKTETLPEKITRDILEKHKIPFEQEYPLEKRTDGRFTYRFDFKLNNDILIEVQGDYWHCNPKIFPEPINDEQRWAIQKDERKKEFAKNKGFKILYLWEHDLYNDIDYCEHLILGVLS